MKASVLIVDDDPNLVSLARSILEAEEYRVHEAASADAAFVLLKSQTFDLLLLDLNLPGISGFDFLTIIKREPRTAGLPVMMITVKGEVSNKVKGLKIGADDYLVKPFFHNELLARVEALLRRARQGGQLADVLDAGGICVDFERRQITVKGRAVELSTTEFDFLALLMRHGGRPLTYQNLCESLSKGSRVLTSESLYVHAGNLRKKLGSQGKSIETVYGVGYKFSA